MVKTWPTFSITLHEPRHRKWTAKTATFNHVEPQTYDLKMFLAHSWFITLVQGRYARRFHMDPEKRNRISPEDPDAFCARGPCNVTLPLRGKLLQAVQKVPNGPTACPSRYRAALWKTALGFLYKGFGREHEEFPLQEETTLWEALCGPFAFWRFSRASLQGPVWLCG